MSVLGITGITCRMPTDWLHDVSACWYDWQTFLAGCLALLGAYLTVRKIRAQIEQSDHQENKRIERRHRSARVTLPLALSAINEMCRAAAQQIGHQIIVRRDFGAAFSERSDRENYPTRLDPISLPNNVISEMKQFVESLRGEQSVKHVAELMSSIQIMISRFNSFELDQGDELVVLGLSDLLMDVAKVRFLNDKMFNYARFADDQFAVVGRIPHAEAWDEIHQRLEGFIFEKKIPEGFFNPFNERIQRYKKEGRSPWIEKFER